MPITPGPGKDAGNISPFTEKLRGPRRLTEEQYQKGRAMRMEGVDFSDIAAMVGAREADVEHDLQIIRTKHPLPKRKNACLLPADAGWLDAQAFPGEPRWSTAHRIFSEYEVLKGGRT